jgi:glycosyltransferase involved in cell wall biosynthesis
LKPTVVFLTSHPMSVVSFFLPHIRILNDIFNIQVLANTNEESLLQQRGVNLIIENIPLLRPISLWLDFKVLWILFKRFKHANISAVHTVTPKAGLIGIAAGRLAGVPIRIHSFTGQVWVTRKGLMRWVLKTADKLIAKMATDLLVDSPSQQAFLIEQGVLSTKHSVVLGSGSICGVNTDRFCPSASAREAVRNELNTLPNTLVCLYLGRLNRDKGVLDLATAFGNIALAYPNVELWVVGPDESNWFEQMQALLGDANNQVKRVGFTQEPERFMQAADLFCLPSYREGFGSSVIEAAACGVPALVSRIYGLTDAVAEGLTGWMHEAGNVQDLTQQLNTLFANSADLASRGQAARRYAETVFAEEAITGAMLQFYKKRFHETSF